MKPHTSLLKAADLVSYPEIGLPSIDDEHRLLLQQLDALIANTEATPDTEHFTSVLGVLGRLLSEHFSHEEEALRTLGMPPEDVDGHLKAHNSIIEQYTQLNFDLMSRLPVQRHDALVMFKEWLIGHFLKYDMKIKSHLPTVPATRYDG